LSVKTAEAILASLPHGAAISLGRGLGRLASAPLGIRRSVVVQQVAAAFPDRSAEWIETAVDECYRHFGREMAELTQLGRGGSAGLPARVQDGDRAVATYWEAVPDTRGGIIVTGHLGNWEVAGAFLAASGIPLAAVVKRQRNPRFDRYLTSSRRRLLMEPIYMEEAYRAIPAALDDGRGVALVADQDAGGRGIFVPFFGRPASTFRGPAKLALAEDVPLFFGAVVRDGPEYRAILEVVPVPVLGPGAEQEYTRRWVARLEHHVRRWPEQYFWFHRRWKSQPPEIASDTGSVPV
jgi:KDO2-lipid IV(A) lauroyltransferase